MSVSDSGQVALAYAEHAVVLSPSGRLIWEYVARSNITSLALSGDGRYLALGMSGGVVFFEARDSSLQEFTPDEETQMEAQSTPLSSALSVSTEPAGARVYVNGSYSGTAPLSLRLSPGAYTILAVHDGYREAYEEVELEPGESREVEMFLVPLKLPVAESEPAGLGYAVAGVLAGAAAVAGLGLGRRLLAGSSPPPEFPAELRSKYGDVRFAGDDCLAKHFTARRLKDGTRVALRVLRLDRAKREVFMRCTSAWQKLEHRNILRLYSASPEPVPHLETELVEGVEAGGVRALSLEALPKPLKLRDAVRVVRGIAMALKHAHQRGVVHGELRPESVYLDGEMEPKVGDFGMAELYAAAGMRAVRAGIGYAAPEVLDPKSYGRKDARTDIYGLGVIFCELLTGKLPYRADSQAELIAAVLRTNLQAELPECTPEAAAYWELIARCISKRMEDRLKSVDEFLDMLDRLNERVQKLIKLKKTIDELRDMLRGSEERGEHAVKLAEALGSLAVLYAESNRREELLQVMDELASLTEQHREEVMELRRRIEAAGSGEALSRAAREVEALVRRIVEELQAEAQ
ncbi:MAG: protein kinase [Euryarchaeota archaeon]|nr:protein kinase [Euryarchaeota archaeon]